MNVQTLQYSVSAGFSAPTCPQLDSERTLVLVFASPEFDQNLAPSEKIAAAYPKSVVVGCSTAGEIVGTRLTYYSLSVATVLAVDEAEQSMTFAGDLPEGSRARLMHANLDRLVQGASQAASGGARGAAADFTLAIAISCVGRRLVLGERTEEEIEATLDALPFGSHQVGFYSYGELCPQNGASCGELHNQTMTITTISEGN